MGQAIFSKLKPPLTGRTHNYAQECSNNMVDLFSYVQKQQQQQKKHRKGSGPGSKRGKTYGCGNKGQG